MLETGAAEAQADVGLMTGGAPGGWRAFLVVPWKVPWNMCPARPVLVRLCAARDRTDAGAPSGQRMRRRGSAAQERVSRLEPWALKGTTLDSGAGRFLSFDDEVRPGSRLVSWPVGEFWPWLLAEGAAENVVLRRAYRCPGRCFRQCPGRPRPPHVPARPLLPMAYEGGSCLRSAPCGVIPQKQACLLCRSSALGT